MKKNRLNRANYVVSADNAGVVRRSQKPVDSSLTAAGRIASWLSPVCDPTKWEWQSPRVGFTGAESAELVSYDKILAGHMT